MTILARARGVLGPQKLNEFIWRLRLHVHVPTVHVQLYLSITAWPARRLDASEAEQCRGAQKPQSGGGGGDEGASESGNEYMYACMECGELKIMGLCGSCFMDVDEEGGEGEEDDATYSGEDSEEEGIQQLLQ